MQCCMNFGCNSLLFVLVMAPVLMLLSTLREIQAQTHWVAGHTGLAADSTRVSQKPSYVNCAQWPALHMPKFESCSAE